MIRFILSCMVCVLSLGASPAFASCERRQQDKFAAVGVCVEVGDHEYVQFNAGCDDVRTVLTADGVSASEASSTCWFSYSRLHCLDGQAYQNCAIEDAHSSSGLPPGLLSVSKEGAMFAASGFVLECTSTSAPAKRKMTGQSTSADLKVWGLNKFFAAAGTCHISGGPDTIDITGPGDHSWGTQKNGARDRSSANRCDTYL